MSLHPFDLWWLLSVLPGLALLRRLGLWLDQGPFAALSASYAATFVLLSPIAIVGYAFGLPVAGLAYASIALIALATFDLTWHVLERERWPRPAWTWLLGALVAAMMAADYWASQRVGSYRIGDAHYHMGKIRMLMDHGFVNWDPFVPGGMFDLVYHSNLYHALIAAFGQHSELAGYEAWSRVLPWTKLVVAGSAEALAFALFRSRVLGLGAAGAAVIAWAPLNIMPYPNQLAAIWLLPLVLARGIDLLNGDEPRRAAAGIAALSLLLAQLHALYYAFACLLLGPALLVALGIAVARRGLRSWAFAPLLGLLALGAGLPWFATSLLERRAQAEAIDEARKDPLPLVPAPWPLPPAAPPPEAESGAEVEAEPEGDEAGVADPRAGNWRYRGFVLLSGDLIAFDPGSLDDFANLRVQLLLALLLATLTRQPRRVAALVAMIAAVFLVLHVPELCTLAARLAGAPWMLRRLEVVLVLLSFVVVPYALAPLLATRGWLRGPVPYLLVLLAFGYAYRFGTDENAWTRARYLQRVEQAERLPMELRKLGRRAQLLRDHVPSGALLAVPPGRAVEIAEICDCYPFALAEQEGTHGIADMPERRSAMRVLLSPGTALENKLAVIRRYGVRHIFVGNTHTTAKLREQLEPVTVRSTRTRVGTVLVLDERRMR